MAVRLPAATLTRLPLDGPVTVLATWSTSPAMLTVGVPPERLSNGPPSVAVPPFRLTKLLPLVVESVPPVRSKTGVGPAGEGAGAHRQGIGTGGDGAATLGEECAAQGEVGARGWPGSRWWSGCHQ